MGPGGASRGIGRGTAIVAVAALLFSPPDTAFAKICGDDVDGRRVPCACGDVVVSDTRLVPSDPVLAERCLLEGLIVRAPAGAESVKLDLGGLALRGRGYGAGIRVDFGGSDGAVVSGGGDRPGEIVGFKTGLVAVRTNALARVERLRVRGSRDDGIKLRTSGTLLLAVESADNGGDGIVLAGEGGRLEDVLVQRNAGSGLQLQSAGVHVTGQSLSNRRHGVVSAGPANDIRGLVVRGNGGRGVYVTGPPPRADGIVSEENGLVDVFKRIGGTAR